MTSDLDRRQSTDRHRTDDRAWGRVEKYNAQLWGAERWPLALPCIEKENKLHLTNLASIVKVSVVARVCCVERS